MVKVFLSKDLPSAPRVVAPAPPEQPAQSVTSGQTIPNEKIEDLKSLFKDKNFSELTSEEKDNLLKLVALSLNTIKE